MLRHCLFVIIAVLCAALGARGQDLALLPQYVAAEGSEGSFAICDGRHAATIYVDPADYEGVHIAVENLATDIEKVTGHKPKVSTDVPPQTGAIVIGTIGKNRAIDKMAKSKSLNTEGVRGQWESFVIQTVDGNLVVAGSDKRGTIYGAYNISENIGVSPWYYWADAPIAHRQALYVAPGRYVMPSPRVQYRGIFLNDEAPCLTSWVKNTFGTDYGGHEFYAKVFELLLRLRGNYLWPAMWGWAFYADDPENSALADKMGIIIGTSHHEPMARNHQEWARHRDTYGAWDYATNQQVIDQFFTEGVARVADKEDIITIGMRGDGDAPMGGKEGHDHEYKSEDQRNLELLEKVIKNQRKIIAKTTGKPASKHPQMWALYKEVQKYYDMGLKVPDDVIILLSDDNWGNIRRVPTAQQRQHPGGWGIYYHVDYVGAPRNSKWLNVTPIQNMWEQLSLAYEYGVDKLWILNVGDLKPMEYPITLFMDLAWAPKRFTAQTLMQHPVGFCAQLFGEQYAREAAEILNLYSKYNGRVTPEMLDANTYNLNTGEWRQVRDEYLTLETRALRLFTQLPETTHDAYRQLILYPVQAMANLYDMYYAQAMNHALYAANNPECNVWAERVAQSFARDQQLQYHYNHVMAGGKWNGMMTQKHIGYTEWHDNFPADTIPEVFTIDDNVADGGYVFTGADGVVVIEAEHYFAAVYPNDGPAKWTVIPDMGRTRSGVALLPHNAATEGSSLQYKMELPAGVDSVTVHLILKSTLPFARPEGHRLLIGFDDLAPVEANYNAHLNDQVGNPYEVFYPTVASRVIEHVVTLPVAKGQTHTLTLQPIEPGTVFEKIIVDYADGYQATRLFMPESAVARQRQ